MLGGLGGVRLAQRRGGERRLRGLVLQGTVVDGVGRRRVLVCVGVDGVHVVVRGEGRGDAGELGAGRVPGTDGGGGVAGRGVVFE